MEVLFGHGVERHRAMRGAERLVVLAAELSLRQEWNLVAAQGDASKLGRESREGRGAGNFVLLSEKKFVYDVTDLGGIGGRTDSGQRGSRRSSSATNAPNGGRSLGTYIFLSEEFIDYVITRSDCNVGRMDAVTAGALEGAWALNTGIFCVSDLQEVFDINITVSDCVCGGEGWFSRRCVGPEH